MPQPQVHSPWEREGSLTATSPNPSFKIWYGLNRTHYSLLKVTTKIFKFFKIVPSSQIPENYANSAQFAHTVRELRKIRTFC